MEDDNIDEMIEKAKSKRRQTLFNQRVALLKAEDAFNELGGKDDYEQSLLAIVTAYPGGIPLSRVREFMPDSKKLDAAKDALKENGVIDVGADKRSPLLTPKVVSTKPDDGAAEDPAPSAPKKPTPKPDGSKAEESKE